MRNFKAFCERKKVDMTWKAYFVDALGAMALGLFASLLIGTIFQTLGDKTGLDVFVTIAKYAKAATGAAIAVAIAYKLRCEGLVLFSAIAVGIAGNELGGPMGAYVAVLVAIELGKMVYKETQVDILVTPAVVIISGVLVAFAIGPAIGRVMTALGAFIEHATQMQPLLMGIVVSIVIGAVLTLPISSAAICLAIGLGGIAGGAATAGCCAQMIGFAVLSFRENRWGGLLAQGLGTSMLQMGNIVKNPRIWIPPTLAAAITGPLATCVFHLENIPIGSGMGTCGLVGPIGIYTAMPEGGANMWIGMLLVCFVLPALLSWLFGTVLRKIGWIKDGDLKIEC
ncbi:MAG: PTS sugar transporter subunit IIC [Bacteroidales bacterium]|nr:PTS sugar transporter subunit IIC [Bacteroidales bacterium]